MSTSIRSFIGELEAQGHEVTLVVPRYGPDDEHCDEGGRCEVIRIFSRRVPFDPEDRLMKRRLIGLHYREFRRRRFDIMHIHTPFVAHYAGVALARRLGIPVVETYHTYFEEYLHHYLRFLPRAWLQTAARWFSRTQSDSVDAMVVPSALMRDVLADYGIRSRMRIIPTGLEASCFEPGFGDLFRAKHSIRLGRPVLCHVGRAAHEKNIDFLIDMVAVARRSVPDILLVLAGEGPALPHLKRKVERAGLDAHVRFIGYLDRERELRDCYCAADVFVFASRTETQGLVLLEAMALGVPVVSTAVLGTVDILKPERGAIIAAEDVNEFAARVVGLLGDDVLRRRKSEEAVAYARSWSAPEMTARLTDFYAGVIGFQSEPTLLRQASDNSL